MTIRLAAASLLALALAPAAGAQPAAPAVPVPEVTLEATPLLDGPCAAITGQPADTAAARELRERLGEFRALWQFHGPALLRAAVEASGQPFRFRETIAALHTCPALANLSLPLSLSVRRYLRAAPAGEAADSLLRFPAVVFHELLHRHVAELLGPAPATPLWTRHAAEPERVRWHLHLMAVEDSAYRALNRGAEWASVRREYGRWPSYRRALRIVDSVGAAAFLAELRALPRGPDTVTFASGDLRLRGLLYRPPGPGPHPAVLYNHGSGAATPTYERQAAELAPHFTRRGYAFFFPLRRGQGLSAGQGEAINDRMAAALRDGGPAARMRVMAELLATEQTGDVLAALAFLKTQPGIDSARIAVAGISFGGIVTVFAAERAPGIRAAVAAAPAALAWADAPELRERLLASARGARVPVFLFQAANDQNLEPTERLAAEMARAGRPHVRKIYPPFGTGVAEGHAFGFWGADQWGPDVFAFLAEHMGPAPTGRR